MLYTLALWIWHVRFDKWKMNISNTANHINMQIDNWFELR